MSGRPGRAEPFHLERFFAAHEFTTPHLLAVSDCESWSVGELLALEEGALERLLEQRLGYTESRGDPELRAAVAAHHPGLEPDDVLVHAAGVEVLFTACHALLRPGERAVVQTPCYQALRTAPVLAGAEVIPWRARWREGAAGRGDSRAGPGAGGARGGARVGRWEWDEGELREHLAAPGVRLLILNTPHNPTGRHFDTATLASVLELARRAGVRVLVDEAYAGTEAHGTRTPSAAELDPTAVALGLVSKALGLPGLRIGWLLSRDRELLAAAERVKDYTTICAPAPAEMLATLALRNRERLLTRTRSLLETNAELLADFMARHGRWFVAAPAEAGSICFPRVARDAPLSAPTLCRRAREEAGVLLAPGTHFGAGPPDDTPDPVARAFRVGFGRAAFGVALRRFETWLAGVEPGGSG